MSRIPVYYDETCLLHCPPYELLSGRITQWFESPDRVKAIKSHLEQFPNEFPILPKQVLKDFGIDPILVIHDARYVDYLRTIYQQWYCFQNAFGSCGARLRRRVGEGGNPESGVVPEMMLHKDLLPANFAPNLKHSIGKVGMHHFDLSSTVTGDTWTSAYAAVQTALTATEAALKLAPKYLPGSTNGESRSGTAATFALIRPPGHHATTNLCGGYCYLNNVTICASHFLNLHPEMRCIIIDVDFHHGNGVEEILQREREDEAAKWRERCHYISLHAHPDYPYYTTHLPTPVPKSVSSEQYISLLRQNLENAIQCNGEQNTLVLVSLGLDTLSEDPIGGLAGFRTQQNYVSIGLEIGKFVRDVGAKTCFLLEGGYVVERLGECVEGVFRGYLQGLVKH